MTTKKTTKKTPLPAATLPAATLAALPAATLAALAKLSGDAAKANRDKLETGLHSVEAVLTLAIEAEVKVLEDQEGVSTPQKARPWAIIHVLLELVNKYKAAAGEAGLNLKALVEMAEKVNDKIAKEAEKKANAEMAALKEPTRQNRKGAVRVAGLATLTKAA
jgi:hypothetical protein